MTLKLTLLSQPFAITRLSPEQEIPEWASEESFFSITRTPEELSIVSVQDVVPVEMQSNKGWRAFKVHGPIDFSEVGVLNSLTAPLAKADISIFAISTFEADYVLVKAENVNRASDILRSAGHELARTM